MSTTPDAGIFFAYAARPALRAETIRTSIQSIRQRGGKAVGWEDLEVGGQMLVSTITDRIDGSSAVVAEISSMNANVLFELGYAIARNKPVRLAFDESDVDAEKSWSDVGIFATVGRTNYGGNAEKLTSALLSDPPSNSAPLAESILAGARPREANAIFAPSLPVKLTPASVVERFLDRQTHLTVLGASEDLLIAPLEFYAREIYRSSAVILHLLAQNRRRAIEHNARASFLAGFAHGLDLPMLMVVETGFQTPLDYKDLLFQYETSSSLLEKVKSWLDSVPKEHATGRRLGRMQLDVELPIRTFGQYVAEYETKELEDYYVQTSEFASVVSGEARIFAGRKGTGKSATMLQVASELSRARDTLVVAIKPSSYELSSLVSLLSRFEKSANAEYFLVTVWSFLIESEIALLAVRASESRPQSQGDQESVNHLTSLLAQMDIREDEDLSVRLERTIDRIFEQAGSEAVVDHAAVAKVLRSDQLRRLRELTKRVLVNFSHIAVLLDNLDKNWDQGEDFEATARFILSLLVASGKLEKEFGSLGEMRATLAIFVRTDILDAVRSMAREPDKIGARTVDWSDEELLVRVLEERYLKNRSKGAKDSMWSELFATEVRGMPTRDYLLWRSLRRPRDLIYFANAALTTAINRRHSIIESSDISLAEKEYSRFAFEALIVESASVNLELEDALFEFSGLGSTLSEANLDELLSEFPNDKRLKQWLVSASFLGIEMAEGDFEYVEGDLAARRKLRVAERHCRAESREVRFRVHPAFRPYLEILDDDLHR